MPCELYNIWRRDISAEYVLRTGRAFPSMDTEKGINLRLKLVKISDSDYVPSVEQTVNLLIRDGFLLG